jgi:hypothetical protein
MDEQNQEVLLASTFLIPIEPPENLFPETFALLRNRRGI